MTIRDVSEEAGVSPATVSRVFNAPETVRPALRERVLATAAALGYRPNISARSLRTPWGSGWRRSTLARRRPAASSAAACACSAGA